MGQYLHIGIVNQLEFDKGRLDARKLSTDQLVDLLRLKMDMNLFSLIETEDTLRFVIREDPLLSQLVPFLSEQFALYPNRNVDVSIEAALEAVRGCSTFEDLVELAKERSHENFQAIDPIYSYLYTDVRRTDTIQYTASLFGFVMEGKIFMEGYNDFLYYLERLIRNNAPPGSIAGAVRAFIQ